MPDYTTKAPGVYIEEQTASGPIAGVSTSIVAFIGVTEKGPENQPTLVTNWTEFQNLFGNYLIEPKGYVSYAMRGFLDNGGTLAYIVRVGAGKAARLVLMDRGSVPTSALLVRALKEGKAGNSIKAAVSDSSIVSDAKVLKVSSSITKFSQETDQLQLAEPDTHPFVAGDTIIVEEGAAPSTKSGTEHTKSGTAPIKASQPHQIIDIRNGVLILQDKVAGNYTDPIIRIADLRAGQKTFRVANSSEGIEPGSVLHLQQGSKTEECVVAKAIGFLDQTYQLVTLQAGLTNTYNLSTESQNVTVKTVEFTLTIAANLSTETFATLSMDPRHSHYVLDRVKSDLVMVSLPDFPGLQKSPKNDPTITEATALTGGIDGSGEPTLEDFQNGLSALEKVDAVSIVCAPGCTDGDGIQGLVVKHCQKMANRFAILDGISDIEMSASKEREAVLKQRQFLESEYGYAALYYPWIVVNDPASSTTKGTLLVPPSGHLAGVYARSDNQRGVHKAPANEFVTGAIGLSRILDDSEQGVLNSAGIDALRIFPGQVRPIVWGARTTAPKDQLPWRFVNVRRLFIFIEESIRSGIRWAIFEPNGITLWKQLNRTITEFLLRVWSSGALAGASASEAFYVKIDEELNPPTTQAMGQVIIEIGIAPIRPAEFVIARISMWAGGSAVNEG